MGLNGWKDWLQLTNKIISRDWYDDPTEQFQRNEQIWKTRNVLFRPNSSIVY